ncbi:hypothetical protein KFK09_003685 [Dendrobium nobile]|uniref:GDT1 family protein n=1 Tax=Dendrobium nobile TaxID=94219 RepID=A0A8T3BYI0_DENNO|nr:hypothetical protein KFK09_003685 [Dendrobium nobile]
MDDGARSRSHGSVRPGPSWSLVYLVRGGSRPNLTEGSLSAAMGCFVQGDLVNLGFDANKEHIGYGHNRYFVVPFDGKTTRFRGPRVITVYPAVPFGGKIAEIQFCSGPFARVQSGSKVQKSKSTAVHLSPGSMLLVQHPGISPVWGKIGELGLPTILLERALLAARNSGAVVFAGTFGALAAMTIISVVLGRTFHYVDDILPFRLGGTDFPIDDFAAVCLLVYFGVTTLLDAASGDELKIKDEQEEAELAISELRGNGAGITAAASTVISTFFLVFVAEWGDKSFFSTIALAAASSPLGVIGGALAGHAFATLLAVLGGSLLGTYVSEKVIAYIGGTLFLVFAGVTFIEIFS